MIERTITNLVLFYITRPVSTPYASHRQNAGTEVLARAATKRQKKPLCRGRGLNPGPQAYEQKPLPATLGESPKLSGRERLSAT